MTRDQQIIKIYDFIKVEHICVLATSSEDGHPQSAAMAFSETKDLELFFSTSNKTRKYQNLINNNNVAFVIGMDFERFITVQYEGIAKEVSGDNMEKVKEIHTSKNEESKKYANSPDNRYFRVLPKWVRYWDVRGNEKFEVTF